MIKQEECIERMTIKCLINDQKLNENKERTGGNKMKTTSQIATENKLAANDLKFKIETNVRKQKEEKESKRMRDDLK